MRVPRATVLVVDDDPSFLDTVSTALINDHEVSTATTLKHAVDLLDHKSFDLILLDLRLPDGDGLSLLPLIRKASPLPAIVVVTMLHDLRKAVEAVRNGATDYVTKDLGINEILRVAHNVIERRTVDRKLLALSSELQASKRAFVMANHSPLMKHLLEEIEMVAPLPTTVLIEGESGTGKEVVARQLHDRGSNPSGPFVSVNLAAIPAELAESILFGHERGAFTSAHTPHTGKFELAADGTLFLDEIGCMPLPLQAKLLRVLQEKEFERVGGNRTLKLRARVIAATHRDLDHEVKCGHFREDLYYRLRVYPIRVPALREHLEDIPALGRYFLHSYLKVFGKKLVDIDEDLWPVLCRYPWPGNVRELENIMQRMAVLNRGEPVLVHDIPYEVRTSASEPTPSLRDSLERFERDFLRQALRKFHGNQKKAAEYLQIPLSTLKFKLRRTHLTAEEFSAKRLTIIQAS
ncbi:MAG TPA: sigma-54 dependent transcriptional regulator [Bdellovibrionota bacterium]|nr:sigma-54 dependent transcriptional regulator [Bdellovibrionota bacterium]